MLICTYYIFISNVNYIDLIKFFYCGTGPVSGFGQNVRLNSSLPEEMILDLTLIMYTLESMVNYRFKDKVKRTTEKATLCKLHFHN